MQNAAQEFAKKYDCDLEVAEEYLKEAKAIHSREDYLVTDDNGDVVNEAGEDDSWNHVQILWNGIHAEAVQKAFDRLTAEDQYFLEARNMVEDNAIRMVTIRKKEVTRRKKKSVAAIYEYQADCNGEWGEIQFDFEMSTVKITCLAEWETTIS